MMYVIGYWSLHQLNPLNCQLLNIRIIVDFAHQPMNSMTYAKICLNRFIEAYSDL